MSQEPIDCDLEFKTKVGTFSHWDNLFESSELRQEQNPPGAGVGKVENCPLLNFVPPGQP